MSKLWGLGDQTYRQIYNHLTAVDLLGTETYPCRNMTNYPRYYHHTWSSSPPHIDSLVFSIRNWHPPLNYTCKRKHVALGTTVNISLTKLIWHFGTFGPIYLIGASFSGTCHNPNTYCQVNLIYIQVGFVDTHLVIPPGIYRRHNVRSNFWWFARTYNSYCV